MSFVIPMPRICSRPRSTRRSWQERLGHSTIAITMDLYSHLMDDMETEAAEKIDSIFAGTKKVL
jgi:integrase